MPAWLPDFLPAPLPNSEYLENGAIFSVAGRRRRRRRHAAMPDRSFVMPDGGGGGGELRNPTDGTDCCCS
jgi:hypothetical protein